MDDVKMIRPERCVFIAGKQADTARNVPLRLVANTESKSASVMSPSLAAGKMPALAQRISMVAKASTAGGAGDQPAAGPPAATGGAEEPRALPPAATISAAAASASVDLRDTTNT